ncbi:pentapeptide repeat-containing protein [Mesorhizobium temperatum]|nr:pentapeptide repeat-containing protein [Mesorhizobium temperatum]
MTDGVTLGTTPRRWAIYGTTTAGRIFPNRAANMWGWRIKQLTVFTVLAVGLGTSYSTAFDLDAVERLRSKPICADCDLSGASMTGRYLPGAILTNANLTGADLKEANINGADLSGANLSGAELSGASLNYANLSGANLSNANLSKASLSGANLSNASLSGALLTGASLRGARLAQARLSGANLEGANLHLVLNLDAALLVDAKLCNTTMPDGLIDNRGC